MKTTMFQGPVVSNPGSGVGDQWSVVGSPWSVVGEDGKRQGVRGKGQRDGVGCQWSGVSIRRSEG